MARNKNLDKRSGGAADPATGVLAINVSVADQTLAIDSRSVHASTSGNLAVVFVDGTEATLPVIAGNSYPWQVRVIRRTGTTAAGFVLL